MSFPSVRALALLFTLAWLAMPAHAQTLTSVTGLVQTANGAHVVHATVALRPATGPEVVVRTDEHGQFVFERVPPGVHIVATHAVGLSPSETRVTVTGAPLAPLSIVLAEIVRERVNVAGDASTRSRVPGSTHVLDRKELQKVQMATDDIHTMLRQVPGLNIQEEDAYGLRPNIGMRGTGTDRSSKITMMEDGVLVAPAPYSAPAAYYAPTPGRMESIEVRKGSSQIKSGPITTGGVLNYVSSSIPAAFRVRANVASGADNTHKIVANVGSAGRHVGWLVETFQLQTDGFKQLDGGGDTGVALADYLGKLRLNTTPTDSLYQELEFKAGRTTQNGQETYLGLTDADFTANPWRRYAASQNDTFTSAHTHYQIRHLFARRTWDITTVVYRNNFTRAWYKLESVLGTSLSSVLSNPMGFSQQLAVLTGDASAPNALVIRNNNRTYYGAGVQSTVGARWSTGALTHALEAGLRYHEDEEDRFQNDDAFQMVGGRLVLTRAGAPGSQTNQVVGASAVAGFVSDTITAGAWTVSPGLRFEAIDLRRADYARTDPARAAAIARIDTSVNVLIPGVGVSYRLGAASIFAGVHKGFAPPGPGLAAETRSEESVNYEAGARVERDAFQAEVLGFFNNYANLLGRDTLSTGGAGAGELHNGGRVQVRGLEASARWSAVSRATISLPVRVAYTFTRAEFRNLFESSYGPWGSVQAGFELPYVPRHQVSAAMDLDAGSWRARADLTVVGRMRTLSGAGALVGARATDTAVALGISGEYALTSDARLYASVQNLTNHIHVVARHPAGVRPGLPRTVMVGLKLEVGR
jgi:Fe(3+) dicitrate transport protein